MTAAAHDETRSSWLRQQLRITWHLPVVLVCLFAALFIASKWNWLTSSPPRVVHFAGTHFEIGAAHGKALGTEIRSLFDQYIVKGYIELEGWSLDDLVAAGHHYEQYIAQPYLEEMHGIAQGSGLAYEHVLVMNTFPDAMLGAHLGACSAFAVRTDKGILVGRNLDWTNFGVAHRFAMVLLLEPQSENRVMSIGWPGMVGVVTGMNDQGLTATLNMAYANDSDPASPPFLIRLRQILEHESSIEEASKALIEEHRTFAANILLASGPENTAAVVELSGRQHAVVPMKKGVLITTNFFQTLPIQGGVGGERSGILNDLLSRSRNRTTGYQAQRALAKVCFRGSPMGMITNQSVVFRPAELSADVAIGKLPASSGRFYEVSFAGSGR